MSFESRSLEKLQEIKRQLPKPLSIPKAKAEPQSQRALHRVETETNPQALFRELMEVSTDGNIPPHLIARLKEAEARELDSQPLNSSTYKNSDKKKTTHDFKNAQKSIQPLTQSKKQREGKDKEEALYASFKRLLLENEEDI